MNERQDLYRVAEMYYFQHQTMDSIAKELGVSRPTVSRLLANARSQGVVRISLNDDLRPKESLESQLANRYHVRAIVTRTKGRSTALGRMRQTAEEGARLFDSLITPGTVAGVAWGSTVMEISHHLHRRPVDDVTIVQLNGAGNAVRTGIPYSGALLGQIADKYGGKVIHFPVPAFFDFAETKRLMWQERSVRAVLQMQEQVDVALFGVGAFGGEISSHVYSGGYLTPEDQRKLIADGVVGDICTVMLKENGEYKDLAINQRATGPTPSQLAKAKRRVAVASGLHRTRAVKSALQTGAITDLVVDSQLAEALIAD